MGKSKNKQWIYRICTSKNLEISEENIEINYKLNEIREAQKQMKG